MNSSNSANDGETSKIKDEQVDSDYLIALKLQNEEDSILASAALVNEEVDHKLALRLNKQWNGTNNDYGDVLDLSSASDSEDTKPVTVPFRDPQMDREIFFTGVGSIDSNYYIDALNKTIDSKEITNYMFIEVKPKIEVIFKALNTVCFHGFLKNVQFIWSKSMPKSKLHENKVENNTFKIILNENVLVVVPKILLLSVLLHEMIHAYLHFKKIDRNSHCNNFRLMSLKLNEIFTTTISTNHTSCENLMDQHKQYWWRCTGICSIYTPFYGIVYSINQPSVQNEWWVSHQTNCGGTFFKLFQLEQKFSDGSCTYKYAVHTSYINPKPDALPHKKSNIKPREMIDLTEDEIVVTIPHAEVVNLDDEEDEICSSAVEQSKSGISNSSHFADEFIKRLHANMDITYDRSELCCPICSEYIKSKLYANHIEGCKGKREVVPYVLPPSKRRRS